MIYGIMGRMLGNRCLNSWLRREGRVSMLARPSLSPIDAGPGYSTISEIERRIFIDGLLTYSA